MRSVKHLLSIISLVAFSLSAHAYGPVVYNDAWTGKDKGQHFLAGGSVAAVIAAYSGDWRIGAASGCAVGALKEVVDLHTPRHTPSLQDAVVTCFGSVVGAAFGVSLFPVFHGGRTGVVFLKSF